MVKVLDFGLAKVGRTASSENAEAATLTMGASVAGAILGTPAYMPPEQARGEPVDKRADIWAFGVVFFELLTGQRMFAGKTVSDVLAAVLIKEPDLDQAPKQMQPLLRHCLAKEPKQRIHHAADLRLFLESPPAVGAEPGLETRPTQPRMGLIASAAAGVLAIALAVLAFIHFRETAPRGQVVRFEVPPPEKSAFTSRPAVSPDGRYIAFGAPAPGGGSVLWLRALDTLDLKQLPGTDGAVGGNLFWSPDSRFIVFEQQGRLRKVEASGGPPQTLCDVTGAYRAGAWSTSNVIVFATTNGTWRVPAAGGAAVQIATLDASRRESQHSGPVFLPDQQHFLYHRSGEEGGGIFLGSIDAKPDQQPTQRMLSSDGNPVYAPSPDADRGYLLFLREGTLMVQTFDNTKAEPTGDPVPLAEAVGNVGTQGFFSTSSNGVLVYRGGGLAGDRQYTWFDRQGKTLSAALEPGLYGFVSLSADGTRAAGSRGPGSGTSDLWLLEFARGVSTRFTFDAQGEDAPVWSPDGGVIAFASSREGNWNLYKKVSTGAGSEELLLKSPEDKRPSAWSPDGKFLLYQRTATKTGNDLMALPLSGEAKPIPVVETEFNEGQGQFSPDSRWAVYRSNESGQNQIYVRPFPPAAGGGQWMVSKDGGVQPRWSRDGKEIFFIAPDNKLMVVDVSTAENTLKSGIPQALFDTQIYGGFAISGPMRWDVSPDGKRFLVISSVSAGTSSPVTVILNWPELLRK
jgi:Tol biopolymer transport system component